jgi:pyruvate dehydrogenase E2 component (dihydrolipoamide acetyltransferase)
MATPVIMPKIEMAQEKATVIEWLKKEGDEVEKGEPLLEVETDKVTMEVEAPASGILAGLRGEPGERIPVTETIAYVLEAGEELPGEELPPGEAPTKAAPGPREEEAPAAPVEEPQVTPVAKRLARAEDVDLSGVEGTGPDGRITKSDVERALEKPEKPAVEGMAGKVRATPAARRIAREDEVDLSAVSGSGPRGRVQADDVRAFVRARAEAPAPAAEMIPLDGMRRTIATRMTESYQTVPHITFTTEVDMGAFEEARARLNARASATDEPHVTVTALLVKIVAWALEGHPWLNSTLRDEEIHLLDEVNVGIAVALETGLIVPVVHAANEKGLAEIAAEVEDLTTRARENRLRPSDVTEGTFTVSNLGPFGIENFTAIINPPEAGILAVGAVRQRFIPDEEGKPVARPLMKMTLSADHRIVDGATAASFLRDLREALESPALLLW